MESTDMHEAAMGSPAGSSEHHESPSSPTPSSASPAAEPSQLSSPDLSDIADLSDLPGTELRKLPEKIVVVIETNGEVYGPIFRQLQIKPEKYQEFHHGVVRAIRNKHTVHLKRGTDSSIKLVTDLLLRAYGYIVWIPGSEWQMDVSELDEGEDQLVFVRGKGHEADNARFYPIIESLWRQMRSIMFVCKASSVRKGGAQGHGRQTSIAPTMTTTLPDGDDTYLADVDSAYDDSTDAGTPPTFDSQHHRALSHRHTIARATSSRKVDDLLTNSHFGNSNRYHHPNHSRNNNALIMAPATGGDKQVMKTKKKLTAKETENAVINLVVQLSEIRANSDPLAFEQAWESNIMRIEELDAEAVARGQVGNVEVTTVKPTEEEETMRIMARGPTSQGYGNNGNNGYGNGEATGTGGTNGTGTIPKSLSNEPFMTTGVPQPRHIHAAGLPTGLPAVMSVYLSVAHLPSIEVGAAASIIAAATSSKGPAETNGNGLGHQGIEKTIPLITGTAAPSLEAAYHWSSAPVQPHDMTKFFEGVDLRVGPSSSSASKAYKDAAKKVGGKGVLAMSPRVVGWVLSYGWNDNCRFVWTGRGLVPSLVTVSAPESGSGPTSVADADATSIFDSESIFANDHQWLTIGLGWRDFQADLKYAATRLGVRVWRMKVTVIVAGSGPSA